MTIQFSRDMYWAFAANSFVNASPTVPEALPNHLQELSDWAEHILRQSPLLRDLDFDRPVDTETLAKRVRPGNGNGSLERGALSLLKAIAHVREACKGTDALAAANAGFWLGQIRSLLVFEKQFLGVAFSGNEQRAQFVHALKFWDDSRESDEASWQEFLTARPWLLTVLAASPVVVVSDKAYVGGKAVDNHGGSVVDYLVKSHLTENAIVIEIKTPGMPLLGTPYRGDVFRPSPELAGATQQAASYRQHLMQKVDSIRGDGPPSFVAWNPHAVVLAGNTATLDTLGKRRSFELYRSELRHVRVITYDELFAAVQALRDALTTAPGT